MNRKTQKTWKMMTRGKKAPPSISAEYWSLTSVFSTSSRTWMYQSWSFEPVKKGVFCGSVPRNFSIAINYLVYTTKSKVIGLNWLLGTHLLHCTDKSDLLCIFTQIYSFEKLNQFDLILCPSFFELTLLKPCLDVIQFSTQ